MAGYVMLRKLTMERKGYGNFKVQIALLFTKEISLKLATFFEFPPSDYDAINRSETPGLDFVTMIDAKDIITEKDTDRIIDALERIDMCGIARQVGNLFVGNSSRDDEQCTFDRNDYPYIEDEQFDCEENTREGLYLLNQCAEKNHEKKIRRYGLPCNDQARSASPAQREAELRIALIGKSGQGKSATANTILGLKAFDTDDTSTSVTTRPSRRSSLFESRKIFVVDTPGLQDTDKGKDRIMQEITRIPVLLEKGVHTFVYVFNGADPRFSKEDLDVLGSLQEAFGMDFTKYCMVLFTRAESTLKQKSLADFVDGQKKSQEFKTFLEKIDWRVIALENSATSIAERHRNQSSVISLVDKIITQNVTDGQSNVYTTDMFKIAQEDKEQAKALSRARGWGSEVYVANEGAHAALGGAARTDEECFQQMCVRLPFAYNDALQAEKGEKRGFPCDSSIAVSSPRKLRSIGDGKCLKDELTTEMKKQQEEFDSMWERLMRWLKEVGSSIGEKCVIV